MELESNDIRRVIQWAIALQGATPMPLEPEDHLLIQRLQEAYAVGTPQVVNQDAPGDLQLGDYVFASRWSDCDPGDPWAVGHISEIGDGYVVVAGVTLKRFPKAMRITPEQGARIAAEFPAMERETQDFGAVARVFGLEPGTVAKRNG